MTKLPHYLYKYPQSNNFYFKVRIPQPLIRKYFLENQFFISSLGTSKKIDAQHLALIIKSKFDKELWGMDFSEALLDLRELKQNQYEQLDKGKNWDFRAYLKERFNEYLAWGKQMIVAEMPITDSIVELKEVTQEENRLFSQYLQSSVDNGDMSRSIDLIAHRDYLLGYLEDYQAYTRSTLFQRANNKQNHNISLSQSTQAEKDFSESGFGADYFKAYPYEINSDEPDANAVKRFIARHASLEFDFKKSLVRELKKYEESYNSFDEPEFKESSLSPTQYGSFEQLFETLNETLKTIKEFKNVEIKKEKQINAVPLQPIVEKFLVEKGLSTQPDTVRQYRIAFNYLYTIIGEDFDLTQFDKKLALKIKETLSSKNANGEKGSTKKNVSVSTINKYLRNYGAFLSWCFSHGYITVEGQFDKLSIKETDKNTGHRRSYTPAEIALILNYKPQSGKEAPKIRNDIYWFPKVALYTGMRLNEIASLKVDDFQLLEGIDFINLTDKNLKTSSSKRIIPIHSKLIKLGFLDYVETKRAAKEKIIFSEIRVGKKETVKYGWGEPISRWFNRTFLSNIGIDKEAEANENNLIDFHSFRTTLLSVFKLKGAQGYMVKQIAGHLSKDDITFDRYGKGVDTHISKLKELIEEFDY